MSDERERRRRSEFLHRVYTRYWVELCRYLRGRFGARQPEPQDIAQHAFAQLAALPDPHSIRNPRAFLYRTAINAAIDQKRITQRRQHLLNAAMCAQVEADMQDPGPERVMLEREQMAMLSRAVMSLSERDRRLLLLKWYEDMSFTEIAQQARLSPSGVRLIVERARMNCRMAMGTDQCQ